MFPSVAAVPASQLVADPVRVRRVLLVKLSSLGDVVHALPLLDALRAGLGPSVFLGWAVRETFAGLLQGNPNLDQVYRLRRGAKMGDVLRFGSHLRGEKFDIVLDAQGLLVSGLVARLTNAPVRIGLDRNREGNRLFLTHPVVPARQRAHMVEKLLGFCDALHVPRLLPRPQTYLACAETEAANVLFEKATHTGPTVGCIVGASTADKVWPSERWAELAELLAKQGVRTVLLGGTGEQNVAARIKQSVGKSILPLLLDLTGKTSDLRLLASLLASCDVVVGGDSGPTHLAVAVGTPVVGLYGVTDPVRTGPQWGSAPATVVDLAETDAPPALRRPRHSVLTDALARIPAPVVADAVTKLLR